MSDITIPKMGMATVEVDLIAWHVAPGDTVAKGDVVAEVESEKANMELESPFDGVVLEILVPAGDSVKPGEVVCTVRENP